MQWSAIGVEKGGRPELDEVSAEGDVPSDGVYPSVVGDAEEYAIVHFGAAAVIPLQHVMRLT